MKHIIRKPYFNWEREEKWLNDLSSKGLALTDYSWCRYVFEDSKPGEYIYRIDLLDHLPTHPQSRKYIEFLEETGVEFVSSYMRWVYFRKKADSGPFNLYSDIPSQIARNKRIRALWVWLAIFELTIGVANLKIGLTPPYSPFNVICGIVLCIISLAFSLWSLLLTRKIRALKKEKRIVEG